MVSVEVDVGTIAGASVTAILLVILFIVLFWKSPTLRASLERGVELLDQTLSDLDEHTKPYNHSRAHLPQTLVLLMASIFLFVGMFTNSILV